MLIRHFQFYYDNFIVQKAVVTSLIFFVLSLFSAQQVLAARSLSVTSNKSALFGDEELTLTASMSGFTSGETIYVKGAFYQDGGTNYFGYTKNGDSWIKNGESTTSQKQIKIGEWDGSVTLKTDFADSGYKGEGGYKVKLGFYYLTSGGNMSSVNWSANSADVHISEPDPTIVPTSTPVPTTLPTSVNSSPASISKPTATKTPHLTKVPTTDVKKNVLGASRSQDEKISKKSSPVASSELPVRDFTKKDQEGINTGAWAIIIAAILLIACAILAYLKIRSKKQEL